MKKGVFVLFLLALIMFVQLSHASFNYKNNTVGSQYDEGQLMTGIINISLQNQTAHSNFTSNFGGNISLLNFLAESGYVVGDDFSCSTINCSEGYVAGDPVTNFNVVNGKSFVGFKINGNGISKIGYPAEANSVGFNVQSDIGPFCYNQLLVDIGGKNERYVFNNKTNNVVCTSAKSYGCFNPDLDEGDYSNYILRTVRYCENISFPAAPAYSLGVKVSRRPNIAGANNATLNMSLYDFNGVKLKGCTLDNLTVDSQELECQVNYGSPIRQNFLVCVSASADNSIYQIRTENSGNLCGTNSNNFENFTLVDPEVFVKPLESDIFDVSVNNNVFASRYGGTLGGYIFNYLKDNYPTTNEKVNCNEGCIFPIGFYGPNQNVVLSNARLQYEINNGAQGEVNNLYLVNKSSGKISSNYLGLDLSKAEFNVPYNKQLNKFILYLDGEKVFEKTINISSGFTFDISPLYVLIGQRVQLSAGNSTTGVNSTIWNFGDGDVVNSPDNSVIHVFSSLGKSNVDVTLIKSNGARSTKNFQINSVGANESAWITVTRNQQRINNISNQIASYPSWISQELNKKLDLLGLNATIMQIRTSLKEATIEEETLDVIRRLLAVSVPVSLGKSKSGSLPISVGYNYIDSSYIKELSGAEANVNNSEGINEAIVKWMNENYRGILDFESIDAYMDNGSISNMMTRYKITLTPNEDAKTDQDVYLIINYPLDGMKFMQDYNEKKIGSATYIILNGAGQTFEFSTPSFVQVKELGVYVSPTVGHLDLTEEILTAEKPHFNWTRFSIWTILIIIITFVVYILLQEWYKYRYESYLFRHRNDLYNIITFIFNSRNNKLNDNDIRKKLAGAGWKGEQIVYAFKKIDGKRTGMFEIPLLRPFEKKKIQREIAKRQIPQSNVNFIKGPRL